MRLRALAVALVLPVGLLAACGGEDNGLTSRLPQEDDREPTVEEDTDATTDTTEAPDETEETDAPEVDEEGDDVDEETDDIEETIDDSLFPDDESLFPDDTEEPTDEPSDDQSTGDTLPADVREQVVDEILAQYDLTEEQAGCMVDELVAIIGVDGLDDMASAGGTPTLTPDQMGAAIEVFTTCDIDPSVLMG